MPVLINKRHLERKNVELKGVATPEELELEGLDELIHVRSGLEYDLEAQLLHQSILVQGELRLALDCECARCLKPFQMELAWEDWALHLPLEGEDKVTLVSDSVDLTPYFREDILLRFPQHPLCEIGCAGLPPIESGAPNPVPGPEERAEPRSAWAELDKLKL